MGWPHPTFSSLRLLSIIPDSNIFSEGIHPPQHKTTPVALTWKKSRIQLDQTILGGNFLFNDSFKPEEEEDEDDVELTDDEAAAKYPGRNKGFLVAKEDSRLIGTMFKISELLTRVSQSPSLIRMVQLSTIDSVPPSLADAR